MCSRHDTTTTTYTHSLQLRSHAQDWACQHYIIGGKRASKALTFLETPLTAHVDWRKVRLSWALYPAIRHPCSSKQPPTRPHAGCPNPTQWVTHEKRCENRRGSCWEEERFPWKKKEEWARGARVRRIKISYIRLIWNGLEDTRSCSPTGYTSGNWRWGRRLSYPWHSP